MDDARRRPFEVPNEDRWRSLTPERLNYSGHTLRMLSVTVRAESAVCLKGFLQPPSEKENLIAWEPGERIRRFDRKPLKETP